MTDPDPVRRPVLDGAVLDRAVLARPTVEAARALLGAHLVRDDHSGRRVGRIVEVEAYIGVTDMASHARFGETTRNRVMFGPPGHAYVYLVYGMHACLNVVTEPAGSPAAVLIRAIEPIEGLDVMRAARIERAARNRRLTTSEQAAADVARIARTRAPRLASGPGLVAAAFGLDQTWTGHDMCEPSSALRLEVPSGGIEEAMSAIAATPRIGVGYAGAPWADKPWRFVLSGHPSVSGPSGARPRA